MVNEANNEPDYFNGYGITTAEFDWLHIRLQQALTAGNVTLYYGRFDEEEEGPGFDFLNLNNVANVQPFIGLTAQVPTFR